MFWPSSEVKVNLSHRIYVNILVLGGSSVGDLDRYQVPMPKTKRNLLEMNNNKRIKACFTKLAYKNINYK